MRTVRLQVPTITTLREAVLVIGGLTAGCVAAFDGLGRPAGLTAVMLAAFTLNFLLKDGPEGRQR